jgi:FlaA1/EpsC-like NDP-sugar epimerase
LDKYLFSLRGGSAGLRNPKAIVAFAHDATIAAASTGVALYLRLGDTVLTLDPLTTFTTIAVFAAIASITFHLFGMYRGVWRYASTIDLFNIAKAATVAILIFLALTFILNRLDFVPRSVPFIQWCLLIVGLGGSRFAYRLLRDHGLLSRAGGPAVPVLLVGAGDAAEQFIRASRADPHMPYRVVGILDDGREFRGRHIHGTAVLGGLDDLPAAVARLTDRGIHVQRLILADPALLDGATKRRLLEQAGELRLSVARLPRLAELQDAEDDPIRPRPVALEDLLGRPQFAHDRATVEQLIEGRRVLITGAGGTIGSELTRQIAALRPSQLILATAASSTFTPSIWSCASATPTCRSDPSCATSAIVIGSWRSLAPSAPSSCSTPPRSSTCRWSR